MISPFGIKIGSGGSTPTPAPVGATLMKTGQTTSYRTGDDGDLEAGRATNFFTLASNNPFGNTNRFTDELGGQTYTNNIVIDWSTYNGSNVLGYDRTQRNGLSWNDAINACLSLSIGTFTSEWRMSNFNEVNNIWNKGNILLMSYSPFNHGTGFRRYWTNTTYPASTTTAYIYQQAGVAIATQNKTTATSGDYYIPVRTFTVTGTTLT